MDRTRSIRPRAGPPLKRRAQISRLFLAFEELLDLVEPGFRARIGACVVLLADGFEFAQQLALPFGQADRRLDHHVAEEVPRLMAAHAADAFRLEPIGNLADDPEAMFSTTLEYLGLAPHRPDFVQHNRARRPYAIEPEVAARLEELLRAPNQRLAEEFGISW